MGNLPERGGAVPAPEGRRVPGEGEQGPRGRQHQRPLHRAERQPHQGQVHGQERLRTLTAAPSHSLPLSLSLPLSHGGRHGGDRHGGRCRFGGGVRAVVVRKMAGMAMAMSVVMAMAMAMAMAMMARPRAAACKTRRYDNVDLSPSRQ